MKGKQNFTQCMGCFFKYCKCNKAKKRISRKAKKELVKFLNRPIYKHCRMFNDELSSCNMAETYRWIKPMFGFLKGFDVEVNTFFSSLKDTDYERESIYINENGRLSWFWEDDSEYGGAGLMPFCYNEKDAGNTWAHSELNDLFYIIYKGHLEKIPAGVNSDKELFLYLRNNPIPLLWKE